MCFRQRFLLGPVVILLVRRKWNLPLKWPTYIAAARAQKSRPLLPVDTDTAFGFFPEEWIAKFNLFHANRHGYDYDYDYAPASLSPKSRLNFQLSCLDSISFLPEERIENPGSFLPVDTYTAFHFFLKSELKIQLFFCQSIRWPCFHLSKERIGNPTLRYNGQVLFPQSALTSCH